MLVQRCAALQRLQGDTESEPAFQVAERAPIHRDYFGDPFKGEVFLSGSSSVHDTLKVGDVLYMCGEASAVLLPPGAAEPSLPKCSVYVLPSVFQYFVESSPPGTVVCLVATLPTSSKAPVATEVPVSRTIAVAPNVSVIGVESRGHPPPPLVMTGDLGLPPLRTMMSVVDGHTVIARLRFAGHRRALRAIDAVGSLAALDLTFSDFKMRAMRWAATPRNRVFVGAGLVGAHCPGVVDVASVPSLLALVCIQQVTMDSEVPGATLVTAGGHSAVMIGDYDPSAQKFFNKTHLSFPPALITPERYAGFSRLVGVSGAETEEKGSFVVMSPTFGFGEPLSLELDGESLREGPIVRSVTHEGHLFGWLRFVRMVTGSLGPRGETWIVFIIYLALLGVVGHRASRGLSIGLESKRRVRRRFKKRKH